MGEKFGRLMNYGDGMYAGQFLGAMYSEAFFETDPVKIVSAGLKAIPAGSQHAEMVRDMLKWSKEHSDWKKTWQLCEDKYMLDPNYQRTIHGPGRVHSWMHSAKINGAYILMGLLYGKGDLDQTIIISMRAGKDSDCNPSNAAGVLFTTLGFSKLPKRFTMLNNKGRFHHTAYNIPGLLAVCEKLARQAVKKEGGRIEKDAAGEEVFVIPSKPIKQSKLTPSWKPGPIANSRFTDAEEDKITSPGSRTGMRLAVEKWSPGWKISDFRIHGYPMFRGTKDGGVLTTHPLNKKTPCVLSKKVAIPAGKKTMLKVGVKTYGSGGSDCEIIVRADGKELWRQVGGKDGKWMKINIDLSPYAGKSVLLELVNAAHGRNFDYANWGPLTIESK